MSQARLARPQAISDGTKLGYVHKVGTFAESEQTSISSPKITLLKPVLARKSDI